MYPDFDNTPTEKFLVEKTQLLNPGGFVCAVDNQLIVYRGKALFIDRTYESLQNVPVLRAQFLKKHFGIVHVLKKV
ncbi:hypothetical protein VCUG_02745 [Vavraia culicis subsp. floridensis]|uniref:Uncharacterized protein n=1 Tax=Vavraia culicis (isolate floridensis) TaxID=948595 RepID=L2GR53_VAVCU|nr:uncharacterized protein VCUG_02745 [Vavraia culicis subsp. floridensis]ELA45768.1 hypothetical protein VCUG_02745 [Vavraia culicis subsp. floridensis]